MTKHSKKCIKIHVVSERFSDNNQPRAAEQEEGKFTLEVKAFVDPIVERLIGVSMLKEPTQGERVVEASEAANGVRESAKVRLYPSWRTVHVTLARLSEGVATVEYAENPERICYAGDAEFYHDGNLMAGSKALDKARKVFSSTPVDQSQG